MTHHTEANKAVIRRHLNEAIAQSGPDVMDTGKRRKPSGAPSTVSDTKSIAAQNVETLLLALWTG